MPTSPYAAHTAQEWLDLVWERAGDPRKSARRGEVCQYEAKEGCPPCFIGAALTPEQAADLDGRPLDASKAATQGFLVVTDRPGPEGAEFLHELQCIHDADSAQNWKRRLTEIAQFHGLTVPPEKAAPTLILSMPITGHVDIEIPIPEGVDIDDLDEEQAEALFWEHIDDHADQVDDTLTWEYTPRVTTGNVCHAEQHSLDWMRGQE